MERLAPSLATLLFCTIGAFPSATIRAAEVREALVEVTVNGETQPEWTVVHVSKANAVLVATANLTSWGMTLTDELLQGARETQARVTLNRIPGVSVKLDEPASRLDVTVQPNLLRTHKIDAEASLSAPPPSPPGGFLNYDIAGIAAPGTHALSSLAELGVFQGRWVATSSWLGSSQDDRPTTVRLDSALVADFPGSRTSLRFGDVIALSGIESGIARIAGVSWGTDFDITPQFITFPLPALRGESLSQSTIDLLVNGSPSQALSVPAGPFAIENLPVPTGPGELSYTVRDLLGRERTVRQRYYISPLLLKPGLNEWNVQGGAKRQNFGTISDDYAGWFASTSFRRGLTERLTGEMRVDADESATSMAARIIGTTLWSSVWTSALECSEGSLGAGCFMALGLQQDRRLVGYGFDVGGSTSRFEAVANEYSDDTPRWRASGRLTLGAPSIGSVSLVGTWRQERDGSETAYAALNGGGTIHGIGHIDIIVARTFGRDGASFALAQFTRRLGGGQTSTARITRSDSGDAAAIGIERNAPPGTGFGYYLAAGSQDDAQLEGGGSYNNSRQSSAITYRRTARGDEGQATTSGALAWLGGRPFLSRRVNNGFAVTRAGGASGLPVYHDGHLITRTDSRGYALIPGLRAFEPNEISIDTTTLPLNYEVETTRFDAIPYRRSGVLIEIPVRATALVRLVQNNGTPVPVGALVRTPAGDAPVGLDGLAYISGEAGAHRLSAVWDKGHCEFKVRLPAPSAADEQVLRCDRPI